MSVSGLNRAQRLHARSVATQAALLGVHNAPSIHYTEGPQRWDGIDNHEVAAKGQFPHYADCSAFATWCLWNALKVVFGLPDIVNGANWQAGWTGTMAQHGQQIHRPGLLRGDLVLYGSPPDFYHVAIIVGWRNGEPLVASHGSEAGPFLLPVSYRDDVGEFRRYI